MQQVVEALAERGVEVLGLDENGAVAVEVPCGEDGMPDCTELLAEISNWLAESALPFVVEEAGDRICVRPPAN